MKTIAHIHAQRLTVVQECKCCVQILTAETDDNRPFQPQLLQR